MAPLSSIITRTVPHQVLSLSSVFLGYMPMTIVIFSMISYYSDLAKSRSEGFFVDPEEVETFDFIVVGGGSAGAVVANRLSENYTVLLLEAGGDPNFFTQFPTLQMYIQNFPNIDWAYKTVPQQHACRSLKNNVSLWPRGKALGGSSIQNSMIYMRGNPKDFDDWANMTGDESWNFQNVLPYFKKLEDYHGNENTDSIKYHGKGGPMHIEKLQYAPGIKYWLAAGKELGYNIVDPNGFQSPGFARMDASTKNGRRFSTYSGYIKPMLERTNLKIYRYTQVTKIHLDDEKRAYGVSYHRHGINRFVNVTKEIIISAGSVNSPQLLMLSGIGPKEHLEELGITPLVDLPVGQNLKDHVFTFIGPFLINKPESFIPERDIGLQAVKNYIFNGSGPVGNAGVISGLALLPSSISKSKYPDIYLTYTGSGVYKTFGREFDKIYGLNPGTIESYVAPYKGRDAFFGLVILAKPKSMGEIKLRSSNTFDSPLIDPKYLSHPDDVLIMIEGIKATLNIFENTSAFQSLGATFATNKYPGCEEYEFRSDLYWECYVRSYTLTQYHPCGTCRMGFGEEDASAVTDSQLRVLKTKNLRVIDASVIPSITNTNINTPTIMIGEKGADLVLRYWQ